VIVATTPAKLFGLFQVSILHNIVHLLFGVAGVALAKTLGDRPFALMRGHGCVAVGDGDLAAPVEGAVGLCPQAASSAMAERRSNGFIEAPAEEVS